MSTLETPNLRGVFRFVARLHTLSKRGMRAALADEPKCRYGMLQHLYNLIEQHGHDGAVSRGLRAMEQDGHITRETDPGDRRKTLVRITPEGERARSANEQAMNAYFARIMARLTPEELAQANAVKDALLAAIEAENESMQQTRKGEPPHDQDI